VLRIVRYDFEEFQAVENADRLLIFGEVEAETGIAFIGGQDELVGVADFHEARSSGQSSVATLATYQRVAKSAPRNI